MANAAGEGMAKQNCEPENEGLQLGGTAKISNQIRGSSFVMLQQNPDPESEIQKAMKLVASMNEDLFRITQTIRERQDDVCGAYEQLYLLEYREESFSGSCIDDGNNAYKERAIKTEEKIKTHNLYFLMHHGTENMAMEKKLLREVNASQKKLEDPSDSDLLAVEEINDKIQKLRRSYFFPKPATRVDHKQVLKEIEELKLARDKVFANAPVKGRIWNSLSSKNVIKQQIQLIERALPDEIMRKRKEHLQLRGRIQVVKQEINVGEKEMGCLKRQLLDIHRRKGEAHKVILKLIKTQNQPI
ncbi:hypothetical protein PTKIN_Ptkin09bG0240900 [Pterospermum kingtungense]